MLNHFFRWSLDDTIERNDRIDALKDKLGYYKELLLVITKKEIKVRYKNSYFGYLWSILNPLGFALVFYFVFKIVMRVEMKDYALFLVVGLFPWQWIANTTAASTVVYVSNASIIKKVNFPRSILPLATAMQDMFHFCCAIPIIILFLLIYSKQPSTLWFFGVPLLLLIQLTMVYGIALSLSSVNLFFRDLEQIIPIFLNFMFYPTPILYPIKLIPENLQHLVYFNPFAPIILSWRSLLFRGELDFFLIAMSAGYALSILAIGVLIYQKTKYRFAEVL